jgi:hypothetical protein
MFFLATYSFLCKRTRNFSLYILLEIVLGNIQIPKLCKKFKCHDFFQSAQIFLGRNKKIPTFLRCLKLLSNINIPKMPNFFEHLDFSKVPKIFGQQENVFQHFYIHK